MPAGDPQLFELVGTLRSDRQFRDYAVGEHIADMPKSARMTRTRNTMAAGSEPLMRITHNRQGLGWIIPPRGSSLRNDAVL